MINHPPVITILIGGMLLYVYICLPFAVIDGLFSIVGRPPQSQSVGRSDGLSWEVPHLEGQLRGIFVQNVGAERQDLPRRRCAFVPAEILLGL